MLPFIVTLETELNQHHDQHDHEYHDADHDHDLEYDQDMSVICSVLNLTAMSLERFYAVVYPLQARCPLTIIIMIIMIMNIIMIIIMIIHIMMIMIRQVCTVSHARRVVAATWLLAAILALPRNWIQVFETQNWIQK